MDTYRVDSTVPVRGSQNLIMLSLLPETSRPFVLCHSTHLTSHPCPKRHFRTHICKKRGFLTSEHPLFPALLKRPYPDSRIIARSSKSAIIWTEAQPTDGFTVALPCRQVVHVRLEVLDDSALVGGRKVKPRMRELHRTHSAVVCLQDGLEVECQAVPERELATS